MLQCCGVVNRILYGKMVEDIFVSKKIFVWLTFCAVVRTSFRYYYPNFLEKRLISEMFPPYNPFSPLTIPGSMCHQDISAHCRNVKCMQHRKDVDDKFISTTHYYETKGCKMLWFAAIHESEGICDGSIHTYNVDYSVALNSAIANANSFLQPVLVLGRYGNANETSTEPKKLGRWALERGVKVIYSPRLSFQEDVDRGRPKLLKDHVFQYLQGPYLRLDIPKFIRDHNLFGIPNVCKDHVLYTDADVIFSNKFTQQDLEILKGSVGDGMVSYGREYGKYASVINTGVMVINVHHFEQELPRILKMARDAKEYPGHDQTMLNMYQKSIFKAKKKFKLLPIHYNWKAYWRLEPSDFSQVKIIHFHGPKPGIGLEEISVCNVTAIFPSFRIWQYTSHMMQGVCCDRGRMAEWSINAINNLKASLRDLCD